MTAQNRPLSPHLQIYRFLWTMALSILHRMTGVFLTVGSIFLVYWVVSVAAGPEAYATAQALAGHWLGMLLMLGWTLALYYHLFNGIRHLFWDAGRGLDLGTARLSGYLVVLAAVVFTVATWWVALQFSGGA